jgi:hypothetical protein
VTVDTTYTERWRQLKEARALSRGVLPGSWRNDQRVALQSVADRYVELRMAQTRVANAS